MEAEEKQRDEQKKAEEEARSKIEDLDIESNVDETLHEARAQSVAASTIAEGHMGCWVHKDSGLPLGGDEGFINFKVIGSVVKNLLFTLY